MTTSPTKSQTLPPIHNPNSPNPNAPIFRPSPARATSLTGTPFQYKTRAASQPAGERIPPSSTPGSGRGSPGMNGTGNGNGNSNGNGNGGGPYGVIGGSRTPGRFSTALAGGNHNGPGTQTRANSFSAGEVREPRTTILNRTLSSHTEEFFPSRSQSTSPFPTFSPNSTPSTSPAAIRQHPLPPSPPKAGATASRSRSQSLATGVRPTNIDRPWFGTMSSLENAGAFSKMDVGWNISPNEGSNMSPFSRGLPSLGNNPARDEMYGRNGVTPQGGRFKELNSRTGGGWGASAPDPSSALSSSVHKALGGGYGQPFTPPAGVGYGESNGNKSGTSSRRHSVSVVGGPGGRREFAFGEPGMGITSLSPPSRGLFGFESDLGNALSLDIDENRKGRKDDGLGSGSLPKFGFGETTGHQRVHSLNKPKEEIFPSFGSTPPRGRLESFGIPGERTTSGDCNGKRFPMENAAVGSPIVGNERLMNGNGNGNGLTGSPEGMKDLSLANSTSTIRSGVSAQGPGAIGTGTPSMNQGPPQSQQTSFVPGQSPYSMGNRPFGNPPLPSGPTPGLGLLGSGSQGMLGGPSGFGRPGPGPGPGPGPQVGYSGSPGYYGLPPNRPPPGAQGGYNGHPLPPPPPPGSAFGPYANAPPPGYYPTSSPQPPQPTSPSFSTLSLSDLGKGIPLGSLAITTPLYIVTFKAGRRDIYYCPDPTLLISNGDKVIVEADRGSDLGTVIYDQLTPSDIRDWQERQATAALLSGASQHQPPGMATLPPPVPLGGPAQGQEVRKRLSGEFGVPPELGNMDLDTLLSGCGPSGQPDLAGTTVVRGPLARELTPKRIFAKSSQGVEEQNRMREKLNDEYEAMMICREKVMQRGLPMQIVDAEYQWDRRKLTFYFKADKRVDFRDLTKENFRIFKSRIWMSMVSKDDPRV